MALETAVKRSLFALPWMMLAACLGSGTGSGSASSSAAGGSSSGGRGPAYVGTVILDLNGGYGGSQTPSFDGFACFTNGPVHDAGTACHGTSQGGCCYLPPSDAGAGPGLSCSATFGDITFSDNGSTIGIYTEVSGTLVSSSTPGFGWDAGDTISVSASAGGDVGAYSGTVVAPSAIKTNLVGQAVPRSADWTFTWTADANSGETVSIVLAATTPDGGADGTVSCTAPDSAASLTVASVLLSKFGQDNATLSIQRTATSTATASNAAVTLSASGLSNGAIQLQ